MTQQANKRNMVATLYAWNITEKCVKRATLLVTKNMTTPLLRNFINIILETKKYWQKETQFILEQQYRKMYYETQILNYNNFLEHIIFYIPHSCIWCQQMFRTEARGIQ
jgi:hypothetical protein